jgi:hypothetical protein
MYECTNVRAYEPANSNLNAAYSQQLPYDRYQGLVLMEDTTVHGFHQRPSVEVDEDRIRQRRGEWP